MTKKTFPLRIDEQTFEQLRRWAGDEFRSVNGQIEFLLREALQRDGRWLTTIPESGDTEAGE